jgi:hypothetical protein
MPNCSQKFHVIIQLKLAELRRASLSMHRHIIEHASTKLRRHGNYVGMGIVCFTLPKILPPREQLFRTLNNASMAN